MVLKASRVRLASEVKGIFVAAILTQNPLKYVTIFRVPVLELVRSCEDGRKEGDKSKKKQNLEGHVVKLGTALV
jgi:hypothetical protein